MERGESMLKRIRVSHFGVFLMISACVLIAQTDDSVVFLSAQQAVQMAMENNRTLKSLDHQLKGAEYDAKRAVTNFLPKVSVSGSINRLGYEETSGDPSLMPPGLSELFSKPEESYSMGLQIQQPIFTGFANLNNLRSAQLTHSIQEISNDKVRQNITYAVMQIYWGIVNLQKSKTVADEAVRQLVELSSNQQARVEQGMATEHDFLLTKASLEQARMNSLKVNKAESQMRRQFAILLGLPATAEVVLSDTTTENRNTEKIDLDSVLSSNLSNRPDLKESKLKINLAEIGVKAAKSAWYPSIHAGFSYTNSSSDFFTRDKWDYNWTAYASLNFTLWDWGGRNLQIKKAKEQQLSLSEMYQEKKASVEKEIIDAFHELEQTRKELDVANILAEARERAYNASVAKHEEGVIPMYELLDAHSSFISAKYQVLQAATNFELAVINLELGGLGTSVVGQ